MTVSHTHTTRHCIGQVGKQRTYKWDSQDKCRTWKGSFSSRNSRGRSTKELRGEKEGENEKRAKRLTQTAKEMDGLRVGDQNSTDRTILEETRKEAKKVMWNKEEEEIRSQQHKISVREVRDAGNSCPKILSHKTEDHLFANHLFHPALGAYYFPTRKRTKRL